MFEAARTCQHASVRVKFSKIVNMTRKDINKTCFTIRECDGHCIPKGGHSISQYRLKVMQKTPT